jgi:hypothetical protein
MVYVTIAIRGDVKSGSILRDLTAPNPQNPIDPEKLRLIGHNRPMVYVQIVASRAG